MTLDQVERLSAPHDSDSAELAEIRRWLALQSTRDLWGLTPATRIAFLLLELERLRRDLTQEIFDSIFRF